MSDAPAPAPSIRRDGTVLGFDVGARRIGVAVGSAFGHGARALAVIDVHGDQITVTAQSAYAPAGPCLHQEHQAVEYSRVFTISDTVDRERIDATLKNGVLDLLLPKAEAARPRRIEIKTS